ncbi:Hsp70 family protein [Asticcacaulis benevestitus]|uniref:Chaperone heat shock Hsp70 protein n=1 Tax=Asticcacaulis benevestitus DSM 16100 = ATCC BAA-896 TaxID=1121022 RepID=V4Q7P3_9CAUL|nr:molecular chaperone HscC [Asticcacaulis benevestitus]ESQ93870.1 chaperone heat shock Hsp70 protein [Asticcacaulis benevestitus DSM 16100 = ATCC BAA-896]
MIIGIDLGTTNSAVGVFRDSKAELIPNSLGHNLTPSAVGLDDNGDLLVGLPARERQSTHPKLTTSAFKRYMGSRRMTTLGRREFSPEELSALVLRSLKADAEAYLGEPVAEAVITVPAYFNDKQRKATRRAGELAGLKVERLLNEPTAAALAYGIHLLEDESQFLVFDLGGGTFDVSILEIFEGVIEVRASTGDARLGGEDFNDLLIRAMRNTFTDDWKLKLGEEDALHQLLRAAAEKARRELTSQPWAKMEIVWRGKAYEHAVSADDFDTLAAPLLERLREPVLRSLRDGEIRTDALNEIVLVGGATRMPVVRKAVTRMFGRFPSQTVHPDEAVAMGAAVQAGLKARDQALKEVAVTDVCPYSLGVGIAEHDHAGHLHHGIFSPIIERNVAVPASRMNTYNTLQDNQSVIEFEIYQGESRYVTDNISLGKISVPVPRRPAGEVTADCRFTYDINGLIEVDVHIPMTGEKHQLVIVDEDGPTGADLEKQRKALEALKAHPRDSDANRAALARASRCYENFLGDKREHVGGLMREFEGALASQDNRLIDKARGHLLSVLDSLEGETWL